MNPSTYTMHLFIRLIITLEFLFHFSPQVSSTPLGIVASDSRVKHSKDQKNGNSPSNKKNAIGIQNVSESNLRKLTPRKVSTVGELDTDYIKLDFSHAENEDWKLPNGGFNTVFDEQRLNFSTALQVIPDKIKLSDGPPWSYHDLRSPKNWHEVSNERLLIPYDVEWKPDDLGYSEMRFLPKVNTPKRLEDIKNSWEHLIEWASSIVNGTTLGDVSDELVAKNFNYKALRLIRTNANRRIIQLVAKGSTSLGFDTSFDIVRVSDAIGAMVSQKEKDLQTDKIDDIIVVLSDLENYMTTTNIGTCFQPETITADTQLTEEDPEDPKKKKKRNCMDTLTYFKLFYKQCMIYLQDMAGIEDEDGIVFLLDKYGDPRNSLAFLKEDSVRWKEQYEKFSLDDAKYCWWNEQSPLSISTKRAEQSTFSVYEFDENAKKPYRFRMFLPSDGTTLLTVTLEDCSKHLGTGISLKRGALMGPTLYFERMHIKYSSHQNKSHHYAYGTEHILDNNGYGMELQFVFSYEGLNYWEPYYFVLARTLKEWKPFRSKMTMMLSVFVQVVDKATENPFLFEPISQAAYQFRVQQERQTGKLYRGFISDDKVFVLDDFIPNSVYYLYRGSLTHPPCLPYVMWSIFEKPLQISKKQFLQIIAIPARHFDSTDFVADNIRHAKFIKSELEDSRYHGKKAVRKNRYLRENRIVRVSYLPKGCTSKQHCLDEYKLNMEIADTENRLSGSQSQYSSFLLLCCVMPFFTLLL